jgi:hypothetical protein
MREGDLSGPLACPKFNIEDVVGGPYEPEMVLKRGQAMVMVIEDGINKLTLSQPRKNVWDCEIKK